MLLATGALVEFGRFLQILLWIILPVFISSALITYYVHKRKRSRDKVSLTDPSVLHDQLIFFDHTGVIAEYKQQLSVNHARYTALRHDYESLRQQYSEVCNQLNERRQKDKEIEIIIPPDTNTNSSELRSVRDILEDSKSQIAFLHSQINEQSEQIELLTTQKKALLNELRLSRIAKIES